MDFATLIGLITGTIIIALAILSGSDISVFIHIKEMILHSETGIIRAT